MAAAFVTTSPFHEVLIEDVARTLPDEMRPVLARAATLSEVNEWLAAGAMLRWVSGDPFARGVFLDRMAAGPAHAALALADAVAARRPPPPPAPAQRRADVQGLVLQLALGLLLLGVRGAAIGGLVAGGVWTAPFPAHAWLTAVLDVPLLAGDGAGVLATTLVLGAAAGWHAVEAACAPAWFERVRGWPARRRGTPPMPAWRIDAFQVAWRAHAAALSLALLARQHLRVWFEMDVTHRMTEGALAAMGVNVASVAMLCLVAVAARPASRAGEAGRRSDRPAGGR